MLADGVALAKVKEIVGHFNLATTNRYLRKSGLELKGETDRLSIKIPKINKSPAIKIQFAKSIPEIP